MRRCLHFAAQVELRHAFAVGLSRRVPDGPSSDAPITGLPLPPRYGHSLDDAFSDFWTWIQKLGFSGRLAACPAPGAPRSAGAVSEPDVDPAITTPNDRGKP